MLKGLWSNHRNACLLTLALLVISVVVSPWVLVATILPIRWVVLKDKDQPLTITEEAESMSELPKEWADLDGDKRIEKLRIDDVEISILLSLLGRLVEMIWLLLTVTIFSKFFEQ